uniref:ATP synthase n=1 Tax=Siphoviridae sp. ctCIv11 TaxID=2827806 RepID=A0A8S5S1X4_9CAUD|nr:MAG TPA: ATP synthase [Siphoviridae sp. ctCIv11]
MYLFSENSEEIPLSFGLDFYTIYSICCNFLILYIVYAVLFSTTYCIILHFIF